MNEIIHEAQTLVQQGSKELILVAQDTTLYGQDIYGAKLLPQLLRRLSRIPGIRWLRLLYTHPAHFTPALIDEFATNPVLLKYVDLPLQHINDRILSRMNRPYTRSNVESLIFELKSIPNMAIRTTFITGFPGETESAFGELYDFVAAGHFRHAGCFVFSPESGTQAYSMHPKVPTRIAEQRARALIRAQHRVSRAFNRSLLGSDISVVIDQRSKSGRELLGRTESDAPEIDNLVRIRGISAPVGSLLSVKAKQVSACEIVAG